MTIVISDPVTGRPARDLATESALMLGWNQPVPTKMLLLAAGALTASCLLATPITNDFAFFGSDTTSDGRVLIRAAGTDLGSTSHDPAMAVRSLKARSGLTWEQLAQALGVSRRSVHGWAAGTRLTAGHAEAFSALELLVADNEVQGDPPATRAALLRSPHLRRFAPSSRAKPAGPGPLDMIAVRSPSEAWPDIPGSADDEFIDE